MQVSTRLGATAVLLPLMAPPAAAGGGSAARWTTLAVLALAACACLWIAARRPQSPTATFFGHVAELRSRLAASVACILVATLAAFGVRASSQAPYVAPALYKPIAAQVFAVLADHVRPAGVQLVVTHPTEALGVQVLLAFAIGLTAALPLVLWQMGAFIAPALRPQERRLIRLAVLPAALLFVAGAAFTYEWVLPATFTALYEFAGGLEATPLLGVGDLVGFSVLTMLLFGLAFQTPLVMVALARVGLASPRGYLRFWRHGVVGILVVAAVVTPDPSPVSMTIVSAPLIALYFLGIALAIPAHRRAQARGL